MPLFPNDFKKFKHISTDDKVTILEHPNGHQISIVHDKLSGPLKKQLLAFGGAIQKDKEVVKMKEGGVLAAVRRSGIVGSGAKTTQDLRDKTPAPPPPGTTQDMTPDRSGIDVRTPEQKARYEEAKKLYGYAEGGNVEPIEDAQIAELDPSLARKREIYNSLIDAQAPRTPFIDAKGMPKVDFGAPQKFGPEGQEPQEFNPTTFGQAAELYQKEISENAAKTAAEQQAVIQQNNMRVEAGLSPIPVPNVPQEPQPSLAPDAEQALAPQMPVDQAEPSMLEKGYQAGAEAIKLQQQAMEGLAQNQLTALAASQEANERLQAQYKADYDHLTAEREALVRDIQNGHIDPNKFWEGDKATGQGGQSRVAAAIGMIIAGFNPTNSPNAAINFLKFQMEQNLEAQKANLSKKNNLLSANLQQFGNIKSAMDMTRVMQADIVKNQLEQAAAKASSPLAKAAALKAVSELNQTYGALFQKVATNTTLAKLTSGGGDPELLPALITKLEATDPQRAKELRGRLVPGIGIANTDADAKELKEMNASVISSKDTISKLKEITKGFGKSLSPSKRAEAETLQQTLIGNLRLLIAGPGPLSDSERVMMENIIRNPAKVISLDASNRKALDTLVKTLDKKMESAAKARGLNFKTDDTKKAENISSYIEWARQNPNNPKAKLILEKYGN